MNEYKIRLKFMRPLIGSQPSNEEIRRTYIKNKMMSGRTGMSADIADAQLDKEITNYNVSKEEVDEVNEKSLTVFYRNENGKPCLSDVQIRGFMKDAFAFVGKDSGVLKKKDGSAYSSEDSYRKWIGERICFDKQYFEIDGKIELFERPLRCKTMQGPRVSIACSEMVRDPGSIDIKFKTTDEVSLEIVKSIFERGIFKGISQWANAQYGSFEYEMM